MHARPTTIVLLARATWLVGAVCILIWVLNFGINLLEDPNSAMAAGDLMGMLTPLTFLYLIPGVILVAMGLQVKSGRWWPMVVIFAIGVLSIFKLVLLMVPVSGAIFNVPSTCEIPARVACAGLCVVCVFAWEDLAELSRLRARGGRMGRFGGRPARNVLSPTTWPGPKPPPPARRAQRSRQIQPEDPPAAQTPWT